MNEYGIKSFKEQIQNGDTVSVNTRDYDYYGKVKSIKEDCFENDENGLVSNIYFAHIWAYYKD